MATRKGLEFRVQHDITGRDAVAFGSVLGIERVHVGGGRSEVRLEIRPCHLNELGVVHGGVIMALADEAIGLAAFSAVQGAAVVTAELHVHFLLPARGGLLVAKGQVWRAGRRLVTGEAVIEARPAAAEQIGDAAGRDGQGGVQVVARASGTWATITPGVPLP